jgi:hypothetical protein
VGETTSAVIGGIGVACADQTVRSANVHCVAPCGELVGETRVNSDPSSSFLTERLGASLNGSSEFSHTLRGLPELANEEFGAVISWTQPIVVERAMYADAGCFVWSAGTNATATPLP